MNICVYHGIDLDGFCGGAIYAKAMEEHGVPYELIPMNYGWELPWKKFQNAEIVIIDFSMQTFEDWDRLARMARSIVWIDHHKSAIEDWSLIGTFPSDWCGFIAYTNTKKAGCELAWEYFFRKVPMPRAVSLLGRYDVWDHSDPDVLPFQYGMRNLDLRPDIGRDLILWDQFLKCYDSSLVTETIFNGKLILNYQKREDEIGAKAGCFTLEWEGLTWICANRGGRGSQFFDSVWNSEKFDGMMGFSWNGECWTFGLYSDKDGVDCGSIAKKYGGGGHRGAAGFQRLDLPFDLDLTQKLFSESPK